MAKPSGEIIIFVVAILTTSSSDPSRAAEPCARELAALTHDGVIKGDIDSKGGTIVAGHKFGGGMTILCAGDQITNPDVTIGVNAREPGDAFMLYFGDLAHRVTGVSSREAVKFARQCYKQCDPSCRQRSRQFIFGRAGRHQKPDSHRLPRRQEFHIAWCIQSARLGR